MSGERRFRIRPPPPSNDAGFALDGELAVPRVLQSASAREAEAAPAPAEGRLDPGRMTYDQTREFYHARTPDEIEAEDRPPYEWTARSEEMRRAREWEDRRTDALALVASDNHRKFLEVYSAHRNREVTSLQRATAARRGAFREEEERNFRWQQQGTDVLERATTGATEPPRGDPSPYIAPAPDRPLLDRPIGRPPPPLPPPSERGEDVRTLSPARQARLDERTRSARIFGWFERPEITGLQGLSAEVYGHVEAAFEDLKEILPQYEEVEDMNDLVGTDVVAVRNAFARMAATMATITDFFNAPVTALDRNYSRLSGMIGKYVVSLNRWRPDGESFSKRDADEMRADAENKMMLPAAYRSTPVARVASSSVIGRRRMR